MDAISITGKVISSWEGKLPASAGISLQLSQFSLASSTARWNEAGEFTIEASPGTYEVTGDINGMHIASVKASGARR